MGRSKGIPENVHKYLWVLSFWATRGIDCEVVLRRWICKNTWCEWMCFCCLTICTSISQEVALGNKLWLWDFHTVSLLESALGSTTREKAAAEVLGLAWTYRIKQESSLPCSLINQSLNTLPWKGDRDWGKADLLSWEQLLERGWIESW